MSVLRINTITYLNNNLHTHKVGFKEYTYSITQLLTNVENMYTYLFSTVHAHYLACKVEIW